MEKLTAWKALFRPLSQPHCPRILMEVRATEGPANNRS
jgi:hypothetical protein